MVSEHVWLCTCVQIRLCPYSNNRAQNVPRRSLDGVYSSYFRKSALPGGCGGCKHAHACRIQARINTGETTVEDLEKELSLYLMHRFDVHGYDLHPPLVKACTILLCNVNPLTNFGPNLYCRERSKPSGQKDDELYAGGSVENWETSLSHRGNVWKMVACHRWQRPHHRPHHQRVQNASTST